MNGLDPIPHLKVAKAPPDSKVGCPVCKTKRKYSHAAVTIRTTITSPARRPPALSFTSLGVSTFGVGGASRSLDLMLAYNPANHNWQLPRLVSSLVKTKPPDMTKRMGSTACRN